VGSIYYSNNDRFQWLEAEGAHQGVEFCRNGAENKMVLSVISALNYLSVHGGPDYGHRTPTDRKLIDARLKASLTELEILEQMTRSSPDRTLPRFWGPGRCRGGAAGDSKDYAGGVFAVYSAAGRVPP
jgi:hypothetical protein